MCFINYLVDVSVRRYLMIYKNSKKFAFFFIFILQSVFPRIILILIQFTRTGDISIRFILFQTTNDRLNSQGFLFSTSYS